jgi:hypothetical protein
VTTDRTGGSGHLLANKNNGLFLFGRFMAPHYGEEKL